MNTNAPPLYPLSALPLVVANAAMEVHQHVKAPDALVGMAFLTALSVSCQGLIDVRLPTGQLRPVSLNTKCVADSGERKTGTDDLVSAPIFRFDEWRTKKYEADLKEYHLELRFWKAIEAGIQRRLTKALQNGELLDDGKREIYPTVPWSAVVGRPA